MKRMIAAGLLMISLGCSKKSEPVSNAATSYTKSLQDDVGQARAAAGVANKSIDAEKETAQEAQNNTE